MTAFTILSGVTAPKLSFDSLGAFIMSVGDVKLGVDSRKKLAKLVSRKDKL
jgi:hypothetical protein